MEKNVSLIPPKPMEQKNEKEIHLKADCGCIVYTDESIETNPTCKIHPSQPAIPVGKCLCQGGSKEWQFIFHSPKECFHRIQPSTPYVQESWGKMQIWGRFEKLIATGEILDNEGNDITELIKDFIEKVEQSAYERGIAEESTNCYQHCEQATLTERARILSEVENVIEQEATWYNTNNQIPDSELGKSDEHWKMLQKIVKDSLKEASERMIRDIKKLITQG